MVSVSSANLKVPFNYLSLFSYRSGPFLDQGGLGSTLGGNPTCQPKLDDSEFQGVVRIGPKMSISCIRMEEKVPSFSMYILFGPFYVVVFLLGWEIWVAFDVAFSLALLLRKRAKYGFGEHGFTHRAQ